MTGLRILHLSDTHLMASGARHEGTVDTVAAYRFTLESFANAGPLDLVVLSGDVSDDGSPTSYAILRSLTEAFAQEHGAVAVYAMGNHDQRAGFREVLGNGHPGTQGEVTGVVRPVEQSPITGVSHVAGYRIITVDSSVPGRSHGFVDGAQLAWLRSELAAPYGNGTVLVIHHPPVEPVTALHQGIDLLNAAELAQTLAGSDTVAVLSGHYHHHLSDVLLAGNQLIPVIVSSGIVNSNDVLAEPGHERALAGSGGTLITLRSVPMASSEGRGPTARVRALPLRFQVPAATSPPLVFDLDEALVERISEKIFATADERASATSITT